MVRRKENINLSLWTKKAVLIVPACILVSVLENTALENYNEIKSYI